MIIEPVMPAPGGSSPSVAEAADKPSPIATHSRAETT